MSGDLSPENVTRNLICNERGNSTRVLLLVLLLVVAAAGYLYYFTDLIRPKEAPQPAPAQTAQVKMPIPPRPEQPAGDGTAPAKPAEATPPQGAVPPAPAASPAKPAVEQKPAPAVPPAKSEPAKVTKTEVPAKPAPAPPAATKPAAPAPAPAAAKPAAAPAKKVAAPVKPDVPAKKVAAPVKPVDVPAKKEAVPVKSAKKAEKPALKRKGGAYTLLIGDFVPDPGFAAVQAKLKKSGVTPVRKSVVSASEPMNRLFVGQFTDQDMAEAELQKLKKLTSDAFLVADNGTYTLYAGSYFTESRTASEMLRLTAKGVKPVVRKVQATIKVTRVTAGSFASEAEARKEAERLKKAGLVAKAVKAGK